MQPYDGLITVARDAGIGIGLIWAAYKTLGPRVAKVIDNRFAEAEMAQKDLRERLRREEQETARLRAEVLQLVRSESAQEARAREAESSLAVLKAEGRIRELERDKALLELKECRNGTPPEDGPRKDN